MKKVDVSSVTSNILVLSSVLFALAPLLFGDELTLFVSRAVREGTILVDNLPHYLQALLS